MLQLEAISLNFISVRAPCFGDIYSADCVLVLFIYLPILCIYIFLHVLLPKLNIYSLR